jgi:hypothetical protein
MREVMKQQRQSKKQQGRRKKREITHLFMTQKILRGQDLLKLHETSLGRGRSCVGCMHYWAAMFKVR